MFDIGFWELSVIMAVALLVVGPERLPKLARTIGMWVGKGRKILSSVKADIDREIKADELKKIIEQQAKVPELDDFAKEMQSAVENEVEQDEDYTLTAADDPTPVSEENDRKKTS